MDGKKLEQVIKENPDCLFEHYCWQRSVNSFKLATVAPVKQGGVRGLWFWGAPNTGKSHRAREISLKEFGQEPFSKDIRFKCISGSMYVSTNIILSYSYF